MFMLSLTRGGKPPEHHHPNKVVRDVPKILTRHAIQKLVIQILLLPSTKMLSPHTKLPPPNYQNPSPVYQNSPSLYQLPFPVYQNVTPNCACSQTIDHPRQYINSKLHSTKIPLQITKIHCQIIKKILIQEIKLSVQIPKIINKFLLPKKLIMIPLDPDLRSPQNIYRAH